MKIVLVFLFVEMTFGQNWLSQTSGTTASLRGVSAVNAQVVWASGARGTYLKTSNGGETWQVAEVPGAEALDFRGIRAVDEQAAYLLSSGPGDKSQIYKTTDGGKRWVRLFVNPDPKGFFDAIAFWDAQHGIVVGDPVNGQFAIFTTDDGGASWTRRPTPPSGPNEGAFAASNTCLTVRGKREAWFGSGGVGGGRVFHTKDGGLTWTAASTGIRNETASAGVFSVAFADARRGIVVGGDYTKDKETRQNAARTSDGGRTWEVSSGPGGFRSAVAFVPEKKIWVVTGTSGSDVSSDGGKTWKTFDSGAYHALSFATGGSGWAVGPGGRVARFRR